MFKTFEEFMKEDFPSITDPIIIGAMRSTWFTAQTEKVNEIVYEWRLEKKEDSK